MGNYKYYTNHIIGILNFIVLIAFFFGTLFSFEDSRLQNCAMVHKERRADSYISEVDTDESGGLSGVGLDFRDKEYPDRAIDYSDSRLLETVKKGDIFFDSQGFFVPGLGNYAHVAIVEGTFYDFANSQYFIRIIESYNDTGVARGILCPERFNFDNSAMLRVKNASEDQINGAVDFAISQLGAHYNMTSVMGILSQTGTKNLLQNGQTRKNWYCSELVWAAYYEQGIYLDIDDNNDGGSFVFPVEISNSPNAFVYMRYGEDIICNPSSNTNHTFTLDDGGFYSENHNYVSYNNFYKCFHCGFTQQNYYSMSFRSYDRYKEKEFYLSEQSAFLIIFTPYTSGYYVLQTTGNLNTHISILNENSHSSTGGYVNNAYLRTYLDANVTYQIAINAIDQYSIGYTKLIVTKSSGIIKTGYSSINSLNAIKTFTSQFSVSGTPEYSEMLLAVFKPSTTGNYIITAYSEDIDTYLYVVDLTSPNELVENIDYNDDNENDMDTTDSLIYKTFYVSKTYLIIFGSYNPQHHNGVDTLSVRAR